MITRSDVRELRETIDRARVILNTTAIPDGRATDAKELLVRAVAMADEMISRPTIGERKRRI